MSTWLFVGATRYFTLMRPRIVATDPNTPLAGTISTVSLTTLRTLIALSMVEMVRDLSFCLGDLALAGTEPTIVWEGISGRLRMRTKGGTDELHVYYMLCYITGVSSREL